jgi:transcriptional regulator with XRE-family HTH domain
MTVGQRLLQQRQLRKMTQTELAKAAGVSQGLIARIERGQVKDPAGSVILRLAKALGITADWLVGMYEDDPDDASCPLGVGSSP